MARRPDPDRLVTARREAVLAWMRGAGIPTDSALAELRKHELRLRAQGMDPHEQRYWMTIRELVEKGVGVATPLGRFRA